MKRSILAAAYCLIMTGQLAGEPDTSELETLQLTFAAELAAIDESIKNLEKTYAGHLASLLNQYKQAGNLKAVIAVELELENPGSQEITGDYPGLLRYQEVYVRQRDRLTAEQAPKRTKLVEQYLKSLGRLQKELTRRDKIAAAKVVLAESERIEALAREWKLGAELAATDGAVTLEPVIVENPMPGGGDKNRPTYIIESDGTEGTLKLTFEHPLFASETFHPKSASLELTVASARAADTPEEITVFLRDRQIGSLEGGEKGETLAIDLDPAPLDGHLSIALEVLCGSNALIVEKGEAEGETGPKLKVEFSK